MCSALSTCDAFMRHAFIRTSILLIYSDETNEATVNMIDLSRAYAAGRRLTHTQAWAPGNHEDGYLTGLDNLIRVFEDLIAQVGDKEGDVSVDVSKDASADVSKDASGDVARDASGDVSAATDKGTGGASGPAAGAATAGAGTSSAADESTGAATGEAEPPAGKSL
jgi:hypothetical protein